MLISLIFAAVAATTPAAAPASAAQTAAAAGPTASAVGSVPVPNGETDRLICKRYEETGSRTNTRKVCLTKAQWAEQEGNGKGATDQFQKSSRGLCLSAATC